MCVFAARALSSHWPRLEYRRQSQLPPRIGAARYRSDSAREAASPSRTIGPIRVHLKALRGDAVKYPALVEAATVLADGSKQIQRVLRNCGLSGPA